MTDIGTAHRAASSDATTAFGDCIPTSTGSGSRLSVVSLRQCLRFMAAPVFATMSVLTALHGSEFAAICAGSESSVIPLGMGTMYVLMSLFHAGPWLELLEKYQSVERDKEN